MCIDGRPSGLYVMSKIVLYRAFTHVRLSNFRELMKESGELIVGVDCG